MILRLAAAALVLWVSSQCWAIDDPYQWIIAHPDGLTVTTGSGQSGEIVPLMPGDFVFMLTVHYEHIDPLSAVGAHYVATDTQTLTVTGPDIRLIMADGFEDGTTNAWSKP